MSHISCDQRVISRKAQMNSTVCYFCVSPTAKYPSWQTHTTRETNRNQRALQLLFPYLLKSKLVSSCWVSTTCLLSCAHLKQSARSCKDHSASSPQTPLPNETNPVAMPSSMVVTGASLVDLLCCANKCQQGCSVK